MGTLTFDLFHVAEMLHVIEYFAKSLKVTLKSVLEVIFRLLNDTLIIFI